MLSHFGSPIPETICANQCCASLASMKLSLAADFSIQ
jgi:hypothetical protein